MSTDRPVYTTSRSALRQWESLSPEERQISELKGKYATELFRLPFVTGVGVGKSALHVHIDFDVSREDRARIPSKLEGCDVEVIESGRIRPASKAFDSRIRPLVGATQVGVKRGAGKIAVGMLNAAAEGVIRGRKATYIVGPLHVIATDVLHPQLGENLYQPAIANPDNIVRALSRWEQALRYEAGDLEDETPADLALIELLGPAAESWATPTVHNEADVVAVRDVKNGDIVFFYDVDGKKRVRTVTNVQIDAAASQRL